MAGVVPFVLAGWAVVVVVLFATRPGREAALIAMVAGWALLPNMAYPSWAFAPGLPEGSGGPLHALAVPTASLANKATAIGLGCLIGAVVFDWRSLRRVRPGWCDLPMAVWCLAPVASAVANGLGLADGLAQARYLGLAWGVPYLMGRAYLGDDESLRCWGIALVLGGLAYLPLCLLEFARGPIVYHALYGPHPYRWSGSERLFGQRPLGLLEQGVQLGFWLALGAVAAVWLWRSGRLRSMAGVPGAAVAVVLVGLAVLSQSHEALGLMFVALAPLAVHGRIRLGWRSGLLAAVVVVAMAAGLVGAAAWKGGGLRAGLKSVAVSTGKLSFTWRLSEYEDHLGRATGRPLLGHGLADWSAAPGGRFVDPVALGLWFHALGMYGAVGLIASTAVLVAPVVEVGRWLPARAWLNPGCSAVTLAAALLSISLGDSLLNSTVVLPVVAGAGGLNTWSRRRWEGGA